MTDYDDRQAPGWLAEARAARPRLEQCSFCHWHHTLDELTLDDWLCSVCAPLAADIAEAARLAEAGARREAGVYRAALEAAILAARPVPEQAAPKIGGKNLSQALTSAGMAAV